MRHLAMNKIRDPVGADPSPRPERAFEFAVTALVRGRDLRDRDFVEETRLASVSSREARLRLRPAVRVGTKLAVSFSVPARAWLERSIHMALTGTVSRVESDPAGAPEQWVTLQLDGRYRISSPNL
jgi:hypothetical protein